MTVSPDRPLQDRQIVITRAPHQAAELAALLAAQGAQPLLYPCIDIAPPADSHSLDQALQQLAGGRFDWLVLTSANTVHALADRLAALNLQLPLLRVAAVGPATAAVAQKALRIEVNLVAEKHLAEGLAESLGAVTGQQIFLPQSALARPVLAEALAAGGADVTAISAYRTVLGQGGVDLPDLLAAGQVDAITFTSGSTAANFVRRLQAEGGVLSHLDNVCLAAIGPIAARTAAQAGLTIEVVPDKYTLPDMIEALAKFYKIVNCQLSIDN